MEKPIVEIEELPEIHYHLLKGDLDKFEMVRENGFLIKRLKKVQKSS